MNDLRQALEKPTARIAALPRFNGYPVPWFTGYVNGEPEPRSADPVKFMKAIAESLCWVCGQKIEGSVRTFVIGPMCTVNRITSEPPCHLECAQWSVRNCPFLKDPNFSRRPMGVGRGAQEGELHDAPGTMLLRNPKVSCLWSTRMFRRFKTGKGFLLNIGPPTATEWWTCARPATRIEVEQSLGEGLPTLLEMCNGEGDEHELRRLVKEAEKFFPIE
jgi:hypothetical protein